MYLARYYGCIIHYQQRPLHLMIFNLAKLDQALISSSTLLELCAVLDFQDVQVHEFERVNPKVSSLLTVDEEFHIIDEFFWNDFLSLYFDVINEFNRIRQQYHNDINEATKTMKLLINNDKINSSLSFPPQPPSTFPIHQPQLQGNELSRYLHSYYLYMPKLNPTTITLPKWPINYLRENYNKLYKNLTYCDYDNNPVSFFAPNQANIVRSINNEYHIPNAQNIVEYQREFSHFLLSLSFARNPHLLFPTPQPMSFDHYQYFSIMDLPLVNNNTMTRNISTSTNTITTTTNSEAITTNNSNENINNDNNINITTNSISSILSPQYHQLIPYLQSSYLPSLPSNLRFTSHPFPMPFENNCKILHQEKYFTPERITEIRTEFPTYKPDQLSNLISFLEPMEFPNKLYFDAWITIDTNILHNYLPNRFQMQQLMMENCNNNDPNDTNQKSQVSKQQSQPLQQRHLYSPVQINEVKFPVSLDMTSTDNQVEFPLTKVHVSGAFYQELELVRKYPNEDVIWSERYHQQVRTRAQNVLDDTFGRHRAQSKNVHQKLPGLNAKPISPTHFTTTTEIEMNEIRNLLSHNDNHTSKNNDNVHNQHQDDDHLEHEQCDINNNITNNNQPQLHIDNSNNNTTTTNDDTCTITIKHTYRSDSLLQTYSWGGDHGTQYIPSVSFQSLLFLFGIRIIPYQFTRLTDDLNILPKKYHHLFPYNDLNYDPPRYDPYNNDITNNNEYSNNIDNNTKSKINIAIPLLHNPSPIKRSTFTGKTYLPSITAIPPTIQRYQLSPFIQHCNQTYNHISMPDFQCPLHLVILCLNPIVNNDEINIEEYKKQYKQFGCGEQRVHIATNEPAFQPTPILNINDIIYEDGMNNEQHYDPITQDEFNYIKKRIQYEYKQQLIDLELSKSYINRDECDMKWTVEFITPQQWSELFYKIQQHAISIRLKQYSYAMNNGQ